MDAWVAHDPAPCVLGAVADVGRRGQGRGGAEVERHVLRQQPPPPLAAVRVLAAPAEEARRQHGPVVHPAALAVNQCLLVRRFHRLEHRSPRCTLCIPARLAGELDVTEVTLVEVGHAPASLCGVEQRAPAVHKVALEDVVEVHRPSRGRRCNFFEQASERSCELFLLGGQLETLATIQQLSAVRLVWWRKERTRVLQCVPLRLGTGQPLEEEGQLLALGPFVTCHPGPLCITQPLPRKRQLKGCAPPAAHRSKCWYCAATVDEYERKHVDRVEHECDRRVGMTCRPRTLGGSTVGAVGDGVSDTAHKQTRTTTQAHGRTPAPQPGPPGPPACPHRHTARNHNAAKRSASTQPQRSHNAPGAVAALGRAGSASIGTGRSSPVSTRTASVSTAVAPLPAGGMAG
eukprot:7379701-Prymnesium_polylepis.1